MDKFCYKIFQLSQRQLMLAENDRVIVGVSGGRDSICLALFLEQACQKLHLSLEWAHFNHQARSTADRDEHFVAALAEKFGRLLHIFRRSFERDAQGSFQNQAREWRLDEMRKLAGHQGKIALGHQLDDLVETFFWKLGRGSSLLGLNSLKLKNDNIIRPMLHSSREEITAYLKASGQSWVDDESNQKSDYTRNKIRHQIIAGFKDVFGEAGSQKVLGVVQDLQLLEEMFEGRKDADWSSAEVLYSKIAGQSRLFGCETLARWISLQTGQSIDRSRVEIIFDLVMENKGGWKIELNQGFYITGSKKKLLILRDGVES